MKVEAISRHDERDYRDAFEIKINGDKVFSVWDGEPEDANLSRDFNDAYSVPSLMQRAYDAGVMGVEFTIETSDRGWDEEDDDE